MCCAWCMGNGTIGLFCIRKCHLFKLESRISPKWQRTWRCVTKFPLVFVFVHRSRYMNKSINSWTFEKNSKWIFYSEFGVRKKKCEQVSTVHSKVSAYYCLAYIFEREREKIVRARRKRQFMEFVIQLVAVRQFSLIFIDNQIFSTLMINCNTTRRVFFRGFGPYRNSISNVVVLWTVARNVVRLMSDWGRFVSIHPLNCP